MKKGFKTLLLLIILMILLGFAIFAYDMFKFNHLQKHLNEKYSFEISYPIHYHDAKNASEEEIDDTSRVKITVSGEEIPDGIKNVNMSENIVNVKSNIQKMRILVEAIETPKTNLDLDEICKRYLVMFKIYNEDAVIKDKRNKSCYH